MARCSVCRCLRAALRRKLIALLGYEVHARMFDGKIARHFCWTAREAVELLGLYPRDNDMAVARRGLTYFGRLDGSIVVLRDITIA